MMTINDILKPSDYYMLGNWQMWTNDVLRRLDALRIMPKPRVDVKYEPVEFHSDNGFEWICDHASASLDYVIVNHDDAELATVCDSCDAQLIGEEWV